MKKLTLFASAIVAVLAVSSCSNDELTTVETPTVKGVPFTVNVVNNGEGSGATRGTDIATITNFKLNATYNSVNWIQNYNFSKPADSWVTEDVDNLTWPTTVGTQTHTFYAVCDNTTTPPDITAGKFNYTVPATIAAQKDLLVAAVTDAPNETPVELTFKHALALLKVKVGFDVNALDGGANDIQVVVKKITFYNVATSGEFDYSKMNSDDGPWTVSGTPNYQDITIELATPLVLDPVDGTANFETITSEDNRIFVLPHKPVAWEPVKNSAENAINEDNDSYIGITCQIYEFTGSTVATECGYDEDAAVDPGYSDDELNDIKELYVGDPWFGKASTVNDDWLSDMVVQVYAPYDLASSESDLATKTSDTDFEEVFLPLKMTNGFGFNKTNTINVRVDQVRRANGVAVLDFVTMDIGD